MFPQQVGNIMFTLIQNFSFSQQKQMLTCNMVGLPKGQLISMVKSGKNLFKFCRKLSTALKREKEIPCKKIPQT